MPEAMLARDGAAPDVGRSRVASALHAMAMALLVCGAYYLAAEIGLALTLHPHPVSTLWPPNAVLTALLLLTPSRSWWVVLLAALPAHLAVELRAGIPMAMVLCWFVSNSTEALIGAGMIRRLGDRPTRFDSFRRVAVFVLATFVAVFLSSFLDAAFVQLNAWGSESYWRTWRLRFFSNVLATLTLVPLIVGWGGGGAAALRGISGRRLLEGSLLAAGLLAVCVVVFTGRPAGPQTTPALLYAPLPFLLWAAVRFGPAATSGSLLAVALLAISGAIGGHGPFVASTPAENALSMQLFLIVIAVPLMGLAATMRERLRTEDEARQSEERLTLALGAAQLGTWEWHVAGNRGWWSEKTSEIFGQGPDARGLTLDWFLDGLSPEDRPAVSSALQRAVEEGAPFETEFRVLRPDGETRWVLAQGKAQFDRAGRPVRLLGVSADVTERKLADALVNEWKSRYEAAVRSSNKLLYDWDPAANDVTYGGDLERIIGYSQAEMAGGVSRWIEAIHPADRAAFGDEVARVVATGDSFRLTYRFYRKDGRLIWLEDRGHFFRDAGGRIAHMVGFIEDISERMHTEQALRSSEERFAKAFRFSPEAIMICRQDDWRILEVNETWETMFGHSREEALERTAADLGLYVNQGVRERLARLLTAGDGVWEYELEVRTRAGEVRSAVLSTDSVEMGGEPCFITFIRDVTDRKRAEAEAEEQRREVAHLSRVAVLGELSGALAHELNQPLTAILANARAAQRLLRTSSPDLSELRDILEDIAQEDRRAGEVIDRLRGLLRKGEVQMRPLDLNEVVCEVLELAHSDLVRRGVAVEARLTTAPPRVLADRVQVQQVLLNLLLNACEAMAESCEERRVTIVTTAGEDGSAELSLADQGTGIPEERIDRIFEPFVTSKPEGLGLGLAVCRSIVNAHGGRLWAENNGDGGATFHLRLNGHAAREGAIVSQASPVPMTSPLDPCTPTRDRA
jgi:PAS domain S-box-containing protein